MNASAQSVPTAEPTAGQGQTYAPEIEAGLDRIAAELRHLHRDPPAGNESAPFRPPALFRALEHQRGARDYVGVLWSEPLPRHFAHRLAGVSRKIAGISGLASLLSADFESRCDSEEDDQIGNNLRGRLFVALHELSHAALDVMSEMSEVLQDRENASGGAA